MHFSAIHPLRSFLSPYLLSLSLQFTPPPIPNPSPHLTLHPASYSQPFTSPHPPCTHPSPHLLSCTFQYSITHSHLTTLQFSASHPASSSTLPPHVPHLSPPLSPQVLFVMTPGIQRRTHSLFDQFQYHPRGEHFSSVLMRIYIGECSVISMMSTYVFLPTLYIRSYGTWDKKLMQLLYVRTCKLVRP